MSQPPAAAPADAINTWKSIFTTGPYTSVNMVQYILKAGGHTAEDFLKTPSVVRVASKNKVEGKHTIKDMEPIWARNTGRCTSFAVKAVAVLKKGKPGAYDFLIYDLKGHRIARCPKTKVVIDSSSRLPNGAFLLPENKWERFEETDASWKFNDGKSKFQADGKEVKTSSTPISDVVAMHICLKDAAERAAASRGSIPTLFRSIGSGAGGQPVYHGMINWNPKGRCIDLTPDLAARNKKQVIQWYDAVASRGTEKDLQDCLEALYLFVRDEGGPNKDKQWEADGLDKLTESWIAAAVNLWGYPKLIDTRGK